MKVWGISFKEIENEWTDDEFFMHTDRLVDRIERENKTSKDAQKRNGQTSKSSSSDSRTSLNTKDFMASLPKKAGS